jgi:Uma2 family endonuclease
MAISFLDKQPQTDQLTYEIYLREPEIARRYSIVEGTRQFMSSPTYRHQRIQSNIDRALRDYEEETQSGVAVTAPCDVLIRRLPRLQVRQPDNFFVKKDTIERGGGLPENGPFKIAPDLIVEILFSSERSDMLQDKLADYQEIGVMEAWIVYPDEQRIEVIRFTATDVQSVATYTNDDTITSATLPNFNISLRNLFKP